MDECYFHRIKSTSIELGIELDEWMDGHVEEDWDESGSEEQGVN